MYICTDGVVRNGLTPTTALRITAQCLSESTRALLCGDVLCSSLHCLRSWWHHALLYYCILLY
jgi:hypothetical protein